MPKEDQCLVLVPQGHHSGYLSSNGHIFIRGFFLMFSFLLKQTFKCGEGIILNQSLYASYENLIYS